MFTTDAWVYYFTVFNQGDIDTESMFQVPYYRQRFSK